MFAFVGGKHEETIENGKLFINVSNFGKQFFKEVNSSISRSFLKLCFLQRRNQRQVTRNIRKILI